LISKEINDAEHEYMNIAPPPQLSSLLRYWGVGRLTSNFLLEGYVDFSSLTHVVNILHWRSLNFENRMPLRF
jgi:hypothetical protein